LCDHLFSLQYILGKRCYEQLVNSFDFLLSGGNKVTQKRSKKRRNAKPNSSGGEEEEDEKSTETEEGGVLELSEPVTIALPELKEEWPAMDELRSKHLLCIAQMLRAISPRPNSSSSIETTDNTTTHEYLEQDPISPREFCDLMKIFLEENYCAPWGLPSTSPVLSLCKELCLYAALYGKTFGAAAVQNYFAEPFHTLLMQRSTQGYFEFNLKALPSGVFAGYCYMLAATKLKSEFNKVKMLIANALFLHSRDSCSLHGVRAAIMVLCHSEDAVLIAHEVILPALRSCASCADPAVRRTASNIFYTLMAYLADAVDFDATTTAAAAAASNANVTSNDLASSTFSKLQNKHASRIPAPSELLEECWQLASQLVRDDYTSIGAMGMPDASNGASTDLLPIDEHSADWSCVAVALGPLFCLYSRMLRSSPHVTDLDLKERRNLPENGRIADQVLALIERLMVMVSGEGQTTALDSSVVQFLVQQQHWETLVIGLLQVVNRLFPTCPEDFRDGKILRWLYRLTEINNMIPDLEQRTRLGQRLISVFSNAAFRLSTEDAMMSWVLPGLDRLRLDFVEANEKNSADELEQLSNDLRLRLTNHTGSQ
uniref:HEAT repeat-containing protein 1 n=1 Tax=Rodentolepis nana TaxID=102285 RepID=A0A0R3T8Y2_RODNA